MKEPRQPAKTSDSLAILISATIDSLEHAREDVRPESFSNGVMHHFVEALARTLLTGNQQHQVQTILSLWKECRSTSRQSARE